jgi:hypothetical protein
MMDAGIQTVFDINEQRAPAGTDMDEKRHTVH